MHTGADAPGSCGHAEWQTETGKARAASRNETKTRSNGIGRRGMAHLASPGPRGHRAEHGGSGAPASVRRAALAWNLIVTATSVAPVRPSGLARHYPGGEGARPRPEWIG